MSVNRVCLENMPEDVSPLLDKNDYLYALLNPDGFEKGIFDVVHMNCKYPQWNNIIMHANKDDGVDDKIVVYTKNDWYLRPFSFVHPRIINETVQCYLYLLENKERWWGKEPEEYDEDMPRIYENIMTRTAEEEVVNEVMKGVCLGIGGVIRKSAIEDEMSVKIPKKRGNKLHN